MGEGSAGIAASRKAYRHGSCEAHDVSGGPAKDRGGATGTVGEAPGAEDGLARLALSQQIFPDAEPSHSERFRANGLASSTVVVKAFRLVHILSVEGS
jgi:hypothetical protein